MEQQEEEYRFGPFRLVPRRHELWRDGATVALGSHPIELLTALVRADGAMVSKQALLETVWPRQIVTDASVWAAIAAIRKALGRGADGQDPVVSVAGRGYRFAMPVTRSASALVPVAPLPLPPTQGNLPAVIAPLIGRDAEIARCQALLDGAKLVTITGMGGVGKTRMALALGDAARDAFADGVWLAEFAALTQPELVPETIAALFGLNVQGGRTALQAVAAYLARKEALLILDNCEHVLGEAAKLAEAVLQSCPGVTLVATSREPLHLTAEQTYRLPMLDLPESDDRITAAQALRHAAVRLFALRAAQAVEGFALSDETAPAVVAICRRLDGIPLALELAAARLRVLTPGQLLDRLDRRFALLTGGNALALPRHQTLTALIDWSWDHLSAEERTFFVRLGVFPGSFSLDCAEAVAGAPPLTEGAVLDLLTGLVDKSLVIVESGRARARYRLLESTRAYAADRLAGEEAAGCRQLLARYMTRALEGAADDYQRTPPRPWLDTWLPEMDNLRAALDWAFGPAGDAALGIRLVGSAVDLWYEASLFPELRRAAAQAKAALTETTPPLVAGQVLLGCVLGALGTAVSSTAEDGRRALAFARAAGDPILLGRALAIWGSNLFDPDAPEAAEASSREALDVLRPLGPTKALAFAHTAHGISLQFFGAGDPRPDYREATELGRLLGDQRRVSIATQNLAEYAFIEGDVDGAVAAAREAAEGARSLGLRVQYAFCELNLGAYLLVAGHTAEGAAHARLALTAFDAMGIGAPTGIALQHLALALSQSGDPRNAARLLGAAEAIFAREGYAREPTERIAYKLLSDALDARLDPAERDQLVSSGATLDIARASALAASLGL